VYDLAMARNDIRIVHNDYPVTSEDSVAASIEVIQAFNAKPQQNWLALRESFIAKGVAPEYRIEALRNAGISPDSQVNTSVKITILKNRELARRAGVTSLPAIIVMKGESVVPISGDIDAGKINQAFKLLDE
jgi:protein-disulfide isomerase